MSPVEGCKIAGGSLLQVEREDPNLNPSLAKFPTFRIAEVIKNGITTTAAPTRPT